MLKSAATVKTKSFRSVVFASMSRKLQKNSGPLWEWVMKLVLSIQKTM
jgi:hypothetical protein